MTADTLGRGGARRPRRGGIGSVSISAPRCGGVVGCSATGVCLFAHLACKQYLPSTKFLVILLHITEDRVAAVVLVVVSDGDTRRHGDTDTGHRHGESHLSHVSFVSLQPDTQTHTDAGPGS